MTSFSVYTRGYSYPPNSDSPEGYPKNEIGSAENVGGGVFLTAAHVFNAYTDPSTQYRYTSASLIGFPEAGGYVIQGEAPLGPYDPSKMAKYYPTDPHYDLATFTVPQVASSSGTLAAAPIVAFADQSRAASFLATAKTVTLDSATSNNGASGTFLSVTADGQFVASVGTQNTDSGGAAMVTPQGQNTSYLAGIVSTSFGQQQQDTPSGPTVFSYLTAAEYGNLVSRIPAGTDFSNMAPDLIEGQQPGDVIRGGPRKADIITDGDNNIILAGNGGLINTGIGQSDVIFMQSALGEADNGTDVVITPGTKTIVGGTTNDKLVLLADRLGPTPASNDSGGSDMSSTIQLVGGLAPPSGSIYEYWSFTNNYQVYYNKKDSDLIISVYEYSNADPQSY